MSGLVHVCLITEPIIRRGVAILINRDPKIDLIRAFNKSDGRIVAARLSINGICYFVLNVYAPTKKLEKEPFYKMLLNWLNTVKEDNDILIAGGGLELCSTSGNGYTWYLFC